MEEEEEGGRKETWVEREKKKQGVAHYKFSRDVQRKSMVFFFGGGGEGVLLKKILFLLSQFRFPRLWFSFLLSLLFEPGSITHFGLFNSCLFLSPSSSLFFQHTPDGTFILMGVANSLFKHVMNYAIRRPHKCHNFFVVNLLRL